MFSSNKVVKFNTIFTITLQVINPRRMREGYSNRSVCMWVCVSVSVTTPAVTYLVLYDANKVPLGFLWHFQGMYCADLVENTSFNSSDDICWPLWPSSLLDELLIDERDSDGFISRIVACSSSDSSCNLTDSSQITVGYRLRFLALLCTRSADLACTWYYYLITCNRISGYSLQLQ